MIDAIRIETIDMAKIGAKGLFFVKKIMFTVADPETWDIVNKRQGKIVQG